MRKLKKIFKSLFDFICGKREITFYFQTVRFSDALLALWYSFAELIGLPLAKNGREEFLREVNKTFDFQGAYLFGSARSGLYSLLKALAFEDGAEVIVTGFTCDVVPNAVIQAGCRPVYADIDQETFCMSSLSAAQCITEKTRAIIIQHTFGIPADIDALMKLADEHSLYVIEDCAVSLGSRYKGQLTGTFGDAAIFSFELSKTITSCRGGLLLINTNKCQGKTRCEKFYQSVPEQSRRYAGNILFQFGLSGLLYRPIIYNVGKYVAAIMFKTGIFKISTPYPEKEAKIADNYLIKLSNQQAALLSRQWKRLKQIKKRSQDACNYFYGNLKNIPSIISFLVRKDMSLNLIRYPLIVKNREDLLEVFRKHNVELGLWFTAPISSPRTNHKVFGYVSGTCPEAEKVSAKICNLPIHYKIKISDMDRIISMLSENARRTD
ncbi:MAG: hypothetical protein SRB1_02024 [Desulfobacteraceae bacterium Eth-SRB1]|nr:MAG: hypothetical protein SRB1_02024 [Desulfobacteraceae bacterium Eth-SRB1]